MSKTKSVAKKPKAGNGKKAPASINTAKPIKLGGVPNQGDA